MAGEPNQKENGNGQILFGGFIASIRSWWYRRRRPQFGSGAPHVSKGTNDSVPTAQLALGFEDSVPADSMEPESIARSHTPAFPATQKPEFRLDGLARIPDLQQLSAMQLPSLTRTFVVDGMSWALAVVLLLVIAVRLWGYNTLQSEMYGDIEIVQTYTRNVLAGNWPWYFTLSSGPLYHYLIAPILYVLGDGYDQIKIASITVSFVILGFVYTFARRFEGRLYGLFALIFAGTGSWLLIFSRLGNSQLFVPLVTISTVYFLYRYIQTRNDVWLYASALAATFGLYSYPQSFVVAPVMWLTAIALRLTGVIKNRTELIKYTVGLAVGSIPFLWMLITDPTQVTGNYITEKIAGGDNVTANIPIILTRGIGAYFTAGDPGFRGNAAGLPHIDIFSSGLLIVGLFALARKARRRMAPLFVIPLVLLHVPSLLVLRYPEQVPSASRSIGAAPFVYLIVALGLYEVYLFLKARLPQAAGLVVAFVIILSVQSNVDRYFVKYVTGMPYKDVPIGRELVRLVDSLSHDTTVYVAGCCWRDTSPEPFFSQLQLKNPARLQRFDPVDTLTCEALAAIQSPAVIVWSFDTELPSPNVVGCADEFRPMLHATKEGIPLFYSAALKGRADPNYVDPTLSMPAEVGDQQLVEPDVAPLDIAPVVEQPIPVTSVASTITGSLMVKGVNADVTASAIDTGSIPDLFDGNSGSLIRGANQNPFTVGVVFAAAIPTKVLTFKLAGMHNFVAILKVTTAAGVESFEQTFPVADSDQVVTFDLQKSTAMTAFQISFFEQDVPDDVSVNIHLREIIIGE